MNRITLDTNILISATLWHGSSEKIIDRVEAKEITLVLSKQILEEYYKVLEYEEIKEKIRNKGLEMKQAVLKISTISEIIEVKSKIDLIKDDPTDNKFIECAIDGKVNYIISKDNHLLKVKEYQGIKIVKPEEFLELMKNKEAKLNRETIKAIENAREKIEEGKFITETEAKKKLNL